MEHDLDCRCQECLRRVAVKYWANGTYKGIRIMSYRLYRNLLEFRTHKKHEYLDLNLELV